MAQASSRVQAIYELANERQRILPMEGLRGFAVLLVFFVHFDALFGPYAGAHPVLRIASQFLGNVGNTGVDLFFVLSGYLIYGSLIKKKYPYAKFIKRRIQRIYPTFLVVLCLYMSLSAFFPAENKIHGSFFSSFRYIVENILLLPGIFRITPIITVAWSLSYEFFFYLLIPVVISLLHMRKWSSSARILFFVGVWVAYILYAFTVPRSQVRLLMFVIGVLLYETEALGLFADLRRCGELIAIAVFAASFLFIYVYDVHPGMLSFLPRLFAGKTILPGVGAFQGPYKVIAIGISCYLLTLYSFGRKGFLSVLFSWTPMRYLGNMSYSYYLIHGLALHFLALLAYRIVPLHRPSSLIFSVGLIGGFAWTWIAATVLFLLIEKPISILRRPSPAQPSDRVPAHSVHFSSLSASVSGVLSRSSHPTFWKARKVSDEKKQ